MTPGTPAEVDLPRGPEATRIARDLLARHYSDALGAEALYNAQLVTTELVANALEHGRGRIRLKAALGDACLRVEVVDDGTGEAPAIREQTEESKGGWGLRIVEAVALRWGAFEGTTHVWADVPRA
jgi:anti-sigma regulatory factor (Ser/Thr protein kinase)